MQTTTRRWTWHLNLVGAEWHAKLECDGLVVWERAEFWQADALDALAQAHERWGLRSTSLPARGAQ